MTRQTFCRFVLFMLGSITPLTIRHFHISHNAPYLPSKFCITFFFSFLLGQITAVPREIDNNAYAKFCGANKVHYGKCGGGVYDLIFPRFNMYKSQRSLHLCDERFSLISFSSSLFPAPFIVEETRLLRFSMAE